MGRLSGQRSPRSTFVADSTPPSCLGVVDKFEVALLSGHRDLGYDGEKGDDFSDN